MAISKIAKRRLTKLIEFMEKLPASANKHFNMNTYISHSGGHDHALPEKPTAKDLHTCGTTACALGWACTLPYFQRLGMTRRNSSESQVFDLDGAYTYELFGGFNQDKTPKQWAKRARKWLQEQSRTKR